MKMDSAVDAACTRVNQGRDESGRHPALLVDSWTNNQVSSQLVTASNTGSLDGCLKR
jgi:hypothetical protein